MWSKILIPLDGSKLADRILPLVRRILERRSALAGEDDASTDVKLLRVVTDEELRRRERVAQDEMVVARSLIGGSLRQISARATSASSEVLVGDPATTILDVATRWTPTLIAMTTHGRTGLARLIRGSVAERVLRSSPCPLLLANPFAVDAALARGELPFQRILVPLDGSDRALEILPRVAALARYFEAEVVLIHVATWLTEAGAGSEFVAPEDKGGEVLARASALLPGVRVRTRLEEGAAAAAILEAAADEKADLLALTTHGRSGPSRWALGSVAENVLRHSRCPVLLEKTDVAASSKSHPDEAKQVTRAATAAHPP